MNPVFVTKGQIAKQVFERVDAALGQEFGALRADALDHAHFRCQAQLHVVVFISFLPQGTRARVILADSTSLSLEWASCSAREEGDFRGSFATFGK